MIKVNLCSIKHNMNLWRTTLDSSKSQNLLFVTLVIPAVAFIDFSYWR